MSSKVRVDKQFTNVSHAPLVVVLAGEILARKSSYVDVLQTQTGRIIPWIVLSLKNSIQKERMTAWPGRGPNQPPLNQTTVLFHRGPLMCPLARMTPSQGNVLFRDALVEAQRIAQGLEHAPGLCLTGCVVRDKVTSSSILTALTNFKTWSRWDKSHRSHYVTILYLQ